MVQHAYIILISVRQQKGDAVDVRKKQTVSTGTLPYVWKGFNLVGSETIHPLIEKDLKYDHGKEQQRQYCEEEHSEDLQIICM